MYNNKLKVEVKVQDVLKALQENRNQHEVSYHEARKKYVTEASEKLRERANALTTGDAKDHHVHVVVPVNFLEEYDNAISMLEMTTQETIQLDAEQFKAYIKDDWSWKKEFNAVNSAYLGGLR